MEITTATCPICKEEIYSRANHDFRYCSCRNLFVDGGPGVMRFGAEKDFTKVERGEIELNVTKKELYDDWNLGRDKYGVARKWKEILSLCKSCLSMTKTIKGRCGKCREKKEILKASPLEGRGGK